MTKTTKIPASAPFVIHNLRPVSAQPPSHFSARVARPNASEPEPASESAYAPMVFEASRGRYVFALRVGAVTGDRFVHERVLHVDHDRSGRVDAAHLLDRERDHHHRAAGAAVLLRNLDPHEAEVEERGNQRGVDARRALHRLYARPNLLLRELRDGVAKCALLFRQCAERAASGGQVGGHGDNVTSGAWGAQPCGDQPVLLCASRRFAGASRSAQPSPQ